MTRCRAGWFRGWTDKEKEKEGGDKALATYLFNTEEPSW
jgi:hypothetical protein